MTAPRHVVPKTMHLFTRRVFRRHYVFSPSSDRQMRDIFEYCLAIAAQRHGVRIVAYVLMSTHLHVVLEDVHGTLPKFIQLFDFLLVKITQEYRGWTGSIFERVSASAVPLLTLGAFIDAVAYTLTNPTEAGAVRYSKDWPGARTRIGELGDGKREIPRPKHWLSPKNKEWGKTATLRLQLPSAFEDGLSVDDFRAQVAAEVEYKERAVWAVRDKFMGAKRCVDIHWSRTATTPEERGQLNPKFKAKDATVLRTAIASYRRFVAAYRAALKEWRKGVRSILFPHGTWKMRVLHGAECEPGPPPPPTLAVA